MTEPFPLTPLAMFRRGFEGFRREPLLLLAGGALTFAVYAAFWILAQAAVDDGRRYLGVAIDVTGGVVAATMAYPWFSYALAAARGAERSLMDPFRLPGRFFAQFVAAFWFWAGVMLGMRYLAGVPAIMAALFYAFYGYVIVDRVNIGGLKALGTSVRIGNKRRIALFAIMALFAGFNMFAAIPLGYGVNPGTIALTIFLLLVSTSITLVGGAALYDTLRADLPDA